MFFFFIYICKIYIYYNFFRFTRVFISILKKFYEKKILFLYNCRSISNLSEISNIITHLQRVYREKLRSISRTTSSRNILHKETRVLDRQQEKYQHRRYECWVIEERDRKQERGKKYCRYRVRVHIEIVSPNMYLVHRVCRRYSFEFKWEKCIGARNSVRGQINRRRS